VEEFRIQVVHAGSGAPQIELDARPQKLAPSDAPPVLNLPFSMSPLTSVPPARKLTGPDIAVELTLSEPEPPCLPLPAIAIVEARKASCAGVPSVVATKLASAVT